MDEMLRRSAFTLIEVLVSIALISLILLGLYRSLDIQRDSNRRIREHLQTALQANRSVKALYLDLLESDGNLTIHQGDFDRLCIEKTSHSLYQLYRPKVCWLITKRDRNLLRVEGLDFSLPLKENSAVAVDRVMQGMTLFDLYRQKGKILVLLQRGNRKPIAFMVQGLEKAKMIKKKKSKPKKEDASKKGGGTK